MCVYALQVCLIFFDFYVLLSKCIVLSIENTVLVKPAELKRLLVAVFRTYVSLATSKDRFCAGDKTFLTSFLAPN
jgi:uncharacterized membrane protein YGL010W